MSPIQTHSATSSNTAGPFSNVSHASKSLKSGHSDESAHMEYLEHDESESQRFQNGKRPPSSSELPNVSESAKRMRIVNSAVGDNLSGRTAATESGNRSNVLDDMSPLNEPSYVVDGTDEVVYEEEQINRSSDMAGIENVTVEALMQSLSPYEFTFNEMGQLMITEPIFENEEPTTSAHDSSTVISDDVVADQQLSDCNINTDDLDDIDQLVAPILENSEGMSFSKLLHYLHLSFRSIKNFKFFS